MARVNHPAIVGFAKNVPDDRLDEWVAAGWVLDVPEQSDDMPAVAGDKEE